MKGKVRPVTGHEGRKGVEVQLCCFFNVDARWGGWSTTLSGRFTPTEREPVTLVQETGSAPGPVWTGEENFAPTGIRSPNRPARRESLYRLRHPGLAIYVIGVYVLNSISIYT